MRQGFLLKPGEAGVLLPQTAASNTIRYEMARAKCCRPRAPIVKGHLEEVLA